MRCRTLTLCALVLAVAPIARGHAQQTGEVKNCESGATARQLAGQPMTDFMKLCRASRVNPENLGKICNAGADSKNLSGTARQTYVKECMTGPG